MDQRDERLVVETAKHRITGVMHLPRDGYRSRLTDYLNASDRAFLPLREVEIAPLDGPGENERRAFLAVSLVHVMIAAPLDSERGEDPPSGA